MAYPLEAEWANGFFNNQIIWVQAGAVCFLV